MRWILLLLLLTVGGCARPPEPLWTELPDPERLLERLMTRSGQLSSLDLEASSSINNQGRHVSSQQFLLVQQPDRIRVDALSGFGQLILQLATDGDILTVFLNTSAPPRFFSGEASQENFSRFVQLPLPASLLVPLLLHDPPVMQYLLRQVTQSNNQLMLTLDNGSFRQRFYFDGQWQLTGMDYVHDQQLLLSVRYSRFSQQDGFPRRIELNIPQEDVQMALRITDVALNPDIPVAKFRLQPPAKIDIEPIF